MKRAYLYGVAAVVCAAAGLVLMLSTPIPLTDCESGRTGDSVVFLHEGREFFPVSVVLEPLSTPDLARVGIMLGDRPGIRIDRVSIAIMHRGEIYLETPGSGEYPPIRLRHIAGGGYGSMLEIPDTGIQGDGAMTISFLVSPCGDEADMTVDINAGLSETGFPYHRYEARHRILI